MKIYWYQRESPTPNPAIGGAEIVSSSAEGVPAPMQAPSISPLYRVWIEVQPDDNSCGYRAIMEKPTLELKFALPNFVEIPVGAWCDFLNHRYYLRCPEDIKKQGTRNIEYTITMYDRMSEMGDYKFRNSVDRRLKWSMCAKPYEFIEEIVKNLNHRDCGEWTTEGGVWSVGSCIDAAEKTIEFNHSYVDEALQSVADNFDTEWEVSDDFVVSLKKIEHNFDSPVALSYGRGNGFVPGVGRTSQSDEKPVKRLYVQGSDRNIDRSKYGGSSSEFPEYASTSADLRLPSAQAIRYDGSHFEKEEGFNEDLARTYQTDADGYYVERTSPYNSAVKEDSLSCDEIYPSRVGSVTKVDAEVKGNPNFYDITDSSIPDSLNFKDYLLGDGDMTIIFQSGMLAGREFGVKYIHADKRFEIVPAEEDGMMIPNATFAPKVGDSYAIFGIMLPPAYFRDNETKTGASWDMFREAVRYLYEHEDQKFTFTGELQGVWAKRNWGEIGGKLVPGGYVLFTDSQFATSGTKIRIKGIKTYVNSPYAPVIELTNSVSAGSRTASTLREVGNAEVVIDDAEKRMKQFTLRRFRDAQETISMLDEAMLDNFTNSISPAAVQTMAMLVGDESLQFRFVSAYLEQYEDEEGNALSVTKYASMGDPVEYDETDMSIHINQSILEHLTLGINSIKAQHDSSEYRRWQMDDWNSAPLSEPEKSYYLYAAVEKTGTSGTYVISSKAIRFDGSGGGDSKVTVSSSRYYLLVGVINSEYDGKRSYVSLFGFTEILPGRITTDKIVSSDGNCFLDLASNAFRIGDARSYIDWNNLVRNALKMNNASISIVNNGGKVMVELNGTDGSGQLAKGNIFWDADGNLNATSGTFTDVLVNGSMRCPFQDGYTKLGGSGQIAVSIHGLHNNNCVVIPGIGAGWLTAFTVPFTSDLNGFRATIINTSWGEDIAEGAISAVAPSGYYFHENGEKLSHLVIDANEGVEMIGVGEGDTFRGWLILNRFRYGVADSSEGFPLKAMFAGRVVVDSNGIPSLAKQKRYNQSWYGFENRSCNISYNSSAPHYVTVNLPKADAAGTKDIFSSSDNYTVLLSGEVERADDGSGVYASVIRKTNNSFTVFTGDDSAFDAGGFTFVVLSTHLWK